MSDITARKNAASKGGPAAGKLPPDENGYELWLRYAPLFDHDAARAFRKAFSSVVFPASSPTLRAAREELMRGLSGLLGVELEIGEGSAAIAQARRGACLIVGTRKSCFPKDGYGLAALGKNGYLIARDGEATIVAANDDLGVLYGVFGLLRRMQSAGSPRDLVCSDSPRMGLRMLDHWDNLDRSVERGYAGASIWDWHTLPDYLPQRYADYARANASIGVNAVCLINVNSNALVLSDEFIDKAAALAGVFRPYGIKVFQTARFNAPMELGGLKTADPLDPAVRAWWKDAAARVYKKIPDFGGFLVKANSEGQPGPQDYGRSHADGANALAEALAPHGGMVIWRAFVYSNEVPQDRAKQAYDEFTPLDGKFLPNVAVQVKNGAIDFQPREPFHPLFGAIPKTPIVAEFQITQEYLGFSTHLAYLGTLFKETLVADTYCRGKGSEVGKVISGEIGAKAGSGMAAVANIGETANWCGHPFGQANWYAFGRLAWDWTLDPGGIASEWIAQTFSLGNAEAAAVRKMMLDSREAVVDYMTPLGLHHIMGWSHHYGPGPWVDQGRSDWTAIYYHRADAEGIGFERGPKGSDATSQYFPPLDALFGQVETCPEEVLLWFHRLPWNYRLKDGDTLWDGICKRYQRGVKKVQTIKKTWEGLKGSVDRERFEQVLSLLRIQEKEAIWWKNACLSYFQNFSGLPYPSGVEKPDQPLEYYRSIKKQFVPGN
jgi:alpha-glucuronidase